MTIGDKIRKYRNLRGITQEELGKRVGLPRDRIRQYETNVRSPKPDLLKKFAEQLNVDVAAISDVDIRDEEDLMHVLFDAEEKYDIDIVKKDGQTMLVFNDDDMDHSVIITYLSLWCDKRRTLGINKENPKRDEYIDWQGQFGSQAEAFKTEMKSRIDKKYGPYLKNAPKTAGSSSSFVQTLKKQEPGYLIDTVYSNGFPGLVFNADKLLADESEAFADFLIMLRYMESLGAEITKDIIYDGNMVKIIYIFPYPEFSVICNLADELIAYNKDKDSYSALAKEEFEKHFQSSMKTFDLNIKNVIQNHKKK